MKVHFFVVFFFILIKINIFFILKGREGTVFYQFSGWDDEGDDKFINIVYFSINLDGIIANIGKSKGKTIASVLYKPNPFTETIQVVLIIHFTYIQRNNREKVEEDGYGDGGD